MAARTVRALVAVAALAWLLSDPANRLAAQTNNCQCEINRYYYQLLVCVDPFCSGGQTFEEFWTHAINNVECVNDCSDIAYNEWGLDGCDEFTCSGESDRPEYFSYEVWWTFYNPSPSGGYFDTEDDTGSMLASCSNPENGC
jgi:hypothetical protein